MGDTGSEGSKGPSNVNVLPPRCPCGFWGSSKTKNLCSKCFADTEKKQPNDDCAPKTSSSTSSSQTDIFCTETNSISQSLMSRSNTSEEPSPGETGVASVHIQNGLSNTDTVLASLSTPTKRSYESASESESDSSPEKRARVAEVPEGFIFCMLHRLPEQHDCLFDHQGRGRQEAVLKMVKLDRKVGRSCQRIGEECS
ncbi:AN1-type zinc finger protein 3-like isoform X2 [Xiphophorus maculatus]|uniref:AN1-type zinc finger protein 3-like isoform X2 n=1 Tax=Xiphophorus maculatus TaxID=8083 RepID=UPI0003B7A079|nr:AN1-type zinc finger protein 3-like isoform X2 [Xiphophorus maculatus]XP_054892865.1 AN1-type zinc finger protein 3-like isoform X2 [Poeciliopsis prolifica]